MNFFLLLIIIPISFAAIGQNKFKGRLVLFEDKKKPLINTAVRLVNEGEGVTGTDGIFTIAIHDTTVYVTLELVRSAMSIIYPAGGQAKLLKNSNDVVEFYVGESTKDILTRAVAKSNNEIKNRLTAMGVKQNGIEQSLVAFRDEVQKMANIKLDDLKDQIAISSKKEDFYPQFASAIKNYTNEAKDLKDAFKFSARHSFDDSQALQVLNQAVNNYSAAFEEINRKYSGYEKMVLDLWNEAKATEVKEFFNYALGELHSANIYTLNLRIKDINNYNSSSISNSKKKLFKEIIIRDIETQVFQLERRLQELDNRGQVILSKLAP